MRWRDSPRSQTLCLAVLLALVHSQGRAQEPDSAVTGDDTTGSDVVSLSKWELERVELGDGRVLEGLIVLDTDQDLELLEVVRAPGRPMYCVVRPLNQQEVQVKHRLDQLKRAQLERKIRQFRYRARIDARSLDRIELVSTKGDGPVRHLHDGAWFRLECTGDEELAKRTVLRLEQVFRGFRQFLPTRAAASSRLRVRLFGKTQQYLDYLARRQWSVANPALYAAEENLIVAGSETDQFARMLHATRQAHHEARDKLVALDAQLPAQWAELVEEMEAAGYNRAEVRDELTRRRDAWKSKYGDWMRRIREAERQNTSQFDELTAEMFQRICHEAFHAYLENSVYPQADYAVPAWLNEGLAQVFEYFQLDGQLLRVDAAHPLLLARLQQDLKSSHPLPLADLLRADNQRFLVGHEVHLETAKRYYLYAWGLAYHLAFESDVLGSRRLDQYVTRLAVEEDPITRFEQLVGTELDSFEQQWRAAIIALEVP